MTGSVTVTFYADPARTTHLGSVTLTGVQGCARRGEAVALQTTWPGLGDGLHQYWYELDSPGQLDEPDKSDNVGMGTVEVYGHAAFLPLVLRGS